MIPQLAPSELAAWRADPARQSPLLIDVREPWEVAICSIVDSHPVPLRELVQRMGELPQQRELVLVCHKGLRSQVAARVLAAAGFSVHNLRGGIAAWADAVEPSLARY